MKNHEIRMELKARNIPQWKLGELLGISENTIYKKLRNELSIEEKQHILDVIRTGEGNDKR